MLHWGDYEDDEEIQVAEQAQIAPVEPEGSVRLPRRRPRDRGSEADDQLPRRSQPTSALQVRLGVEEVPRRLRQPLDAAGNQHGSRRAAMEVRSDVGRRAPHRGAEPGVLLHRRLPCGQQPRVVRVQADHQPRVPPVPATPSVRGGHPHPRLPVLHRVAGDGRRFHLQHVPRGSQASPTRHRGRWPTRGNSATRRSKREAWKATRPFSATSSPSTA